MRRARLPALLHLPLLAVACACAVAALLVFSSHGDADRFADVGGGTSHTSHATPGGAHTSSGARPLARRQPTEPARTAPPVAAPPPAGWPLVRVRLRSRRPRPVPAAFLGLSTEYWAMPHYARERRLFERVVDLLRVPGQPFLLRIGGDSADLAWWDPHHRVRPPWAYALTPGWLTRTARLVADTHLHILLDLNLVDRAPRLEAEWARTFIRHMPRGAVQALEIGNEPDLYTQQGGTGELAAVSPARIVRYFSWASDYSALTYESQFQVYAAALRRDGVTVPLAGPALAYPTDTSWLAGLIASEPRQRLAFVSAHRYPLSACETIRSATDYPTVTRLLSEASSAGVAQSVKPDVLLAHRSGLAFRLTELNAITCGGTRRVSGTFANALWAPDTLFSLMRVGVDGVNVHVRIHAFNAPFLVTRRGLRAMPIFYGLVLFQRMLGRGARLLATATDAPARTHVKAWAVASGRRLRILLIDKGSRSTAVRLRLPANGPAVMERLLAPAPMSRTGVTLAGQTLTAGGHWRGRRRSERVLPDRGSYLVALPAYSAALLELRVR